MTASARAFTAGALNVVQTLFSKSRNGHSVMPLTRQDLYVI